MSQWISLTGRTLISVHGNESRDFLQGLVTQDMAKDLPLFAVLLMPSGRFHSDFFVVSDPRCKEGLLIDCHRNHFHAVMDVLNTLKVLHDVHVEDASKVYAVCAATGPTAQGLANDPAWIRDSCEVYTDPRHPHMGLRALVPYDRLSLLPHPLLVPGTEGDYHAFCIQKGVPQGDRDLTVDKSIVLEYGYHHIQALSWDKGCYRGQELMARTYHRGHLRKHLYRLQRLSGSFPKAGTPLFLGANKCGTMASSCGSWGLASLYTERLSDCSQPLCMVGGSAQGDGTSLTARAVPCFEGP